MKQTRSLIKAVLAVILISSTCFATAKIFNNNKNAQVSDSTITKEIVNMLSQDKITHNSSIDVSTKNGIVSLTGDVDTNAEADTAAQIAESVDGVVDVKTSKLKVSNSDQPMEDSYITAKVKGKFIRDKLFTRKDIAAATIHVETKNGVVYLTGRADNDDQKSQAEKLARSVSGVKDVISNVQVG